MQDTARSRFGASRSRSRIAQKAYADKFELLLGNNVQQDKLLSYLNCNKRSQRLHKQHWCSDIADLQHFFEKNQCNLF